MKELKYWINICKENHYARYLLAKAEYIALFQKGKTAEKLYQGAINFAEKRGHLQVEAIGNFLAAKHYSYDKKLSKFYAKEAIIAFEKWGAMYIASLIANEFGFKKSIKLPTDEKQLPFKINKTAQIAIDEEISKNILHKLNQIESMEENQSFISLLDFISENSHTDYAAILFEKSDEMYLQYEKKHQEPTMQREPVNIKHINYLSRKLIRYVERTGEEVILNKKPRDGIFANDAYLVDKDEVSIVCIPMMYLGIFVGTIYLGLGEKCQFKQQPVQLSIFFLKKAL